MQGLAAEGRHARATSDDARAIDDGATDDAVERLLRRKANGIGIVVHVDGLIAAANDAFAEMFGYDDPDDVVGAKPIDFVAPEARGDLLGYEAPIDGTAIFECLRRDGSRFWIEARDKKVTFRGKRARMLWVVDVTGMHGGETQLREANERFRLAFNNAPIGMALVGPDGRWLYVNPAVCQIVGYTAEQLVQLTFQDITHPDDLETDVGLMHQVLADEIPSYSMEKRYFHSDGHVVWVNLHVSLVRGVDGAPRYFISQIEDVTERKNMEEALRRETATVRLLRQVAVAANDTTYPDEAFATAIEAICAHAGCLVGHVYRRAADRDVLVPTGIWHLDDEVAFAEFRRITEASDLVPGEGLPGTAFARGRAVVTSEVAFQLGPRVPEAISRGVRTGFAFPVWVGKEIVAVLEFFSTDAREPEEQFLEVMGNIGTLLGRVVERAAIIEQQHALVVARSRFVANAAHELRTPLATLRTVAGLLGSRRDDMQPDEVEQCCEILERQGRHLDTLVDDLLDLTAIEHGTPDAPVVPIEVDALIDHAIAIAHPPVDVTLTTQLDDGIVVSGDLDRLTRVLVNLLTNAYRHGGPNVQVTSSVDGNAALILVEDDGDGVSEAVAAQLFEPFTRATSRGDKGNGLGLAIARGIVEHHDGTIAYESRLPTGARFVVRLPRASE
jgi:PAS domain S-box-containing protein